MTEDVKKILITQDYNPLKGTGISVATFGMAMELVKLRCKVTLATYDVPDEFAEKTVNGVLIVKLKDIKDLCEEIGRADVIVPAVSFSYIFKNFGITVGKICEINNKPFIPWVHTTLQNSKFNSVYGINDYVQKSNIFLLEQMFKSPLCKKIICVSKSSANSVSLLGVDEKKIEVIYNGLDIKGIINRVGEISRKETDVICVQRFSPEKGSTLTVATLLNLKKFVPDFKGVIIGDGEEIGTVKSLIKVFGLENNLMLIPKLINGECVREIARSKAFLSTSYTESFGLTIAESMLVGTPVVVPNIEGPKELTEEGKCGFIFNLGDTVKSAQILGGIITGEFKTDKIAQKAKDKIIVECDVVMQAKKFYEAVAR